ncbi:hypothetical protein ES708_18589 [subsurface metagenome]
MVRKIGWKFFSWVCDRQNRRTDREGRRAKIHRQAEVRKAGFCESNLGNGFVFSIFLWEVGKQALDHELDGGIGGGFLV